MTEELIHELLRRQDTFSEQLGALARNQAASAEEHRELVGFLGRKFDRIDRRFVKLEVGLEGVRDEVRILAVGIAGTNQRLDRFQERLEHLEAG